MKKVFSVFLPTTSGFIPWVVYDRIDTFLHSPDPAMYGDMLSLWLAHTILFLTLFICSLLFQLLGVLPAWNKWFFEGRSGMSKIVLTPILTSPILGLIIGYGLWHPAFGMSDLWIGVSLGTLFPLTYVCFNLLTLYYLDKPKLLTYYNQ